MATHYLVLVAPLSIYLFFSEKTNFRSDLVVLLGSLLISLHLLYSETRSAWLAMACMACITLIVVKTKVFGELKFQAISKVLIRKRIFLLVGICLFLVLANYSEHGFQWFFESSDAEKKIFASSSERIELWRGIMHRVWERPLLGWGAGSYEHWRLLHNTYSLPAFRLHNEYLQLIYEIGVVGLLFFMVMVFAVGKKIYMILSSRQSQQKKLLIFVLMLSLSGTGAQSFFTFPYQLLLPTIVVAIYIALISSISLQSSGLNFLHDSNKSKMDIKEYFVFMIFLLSLVVNIQWLVDTKYVDDLYYKKYAAPEFAYGYPKLIDDMYHEALVTRMRVANGHNGVTRMHRLLEQNPHNIFALRYLAKSYGVLGEKRKMEEVYKKMLAQVLDTKTYQRMVLPYLKFLLEEGRREDAIKMYEQLNERSFYIAHKDTHSYWMDSYAMGEGALMVTKPDIAVKYLNKALEVYTELPVEIKYFASTLASAYQHSGDAVMAKKWYKRALHIYPDHPKRKAIEAFISKE